MNNATTRQLLALYFGSISTHFALHSATPCTSANQIGTRQAITWDGTTTLTTLPPANTVPANRLDANVVTFALGSGVAAPFGAWWSASTAGTLREEVALAIPSGSARNVDVDPSYYQT